MKEEKKISIKSIENSLGEKLVFKKFELKQGEIGEFMLGGKVFKIRFAKPTNEKVKFVAIFNIKEKKSKRIKR